MCLNQYLGGVYQWQYHLEEHQKLPKECVDLI